MKKGITDEGFQRIAQVVQDKLPGGLGDEAKRSDFPEDQVANGIKVELEHTNDLTLAEEITKDHLMEDSRYYDKLEKMESGH